MSHHVNGQRQQQQQQKRLHPQPTATAANNMMYNLITSYLTGKSLFSSELQSFCMAIQGNLILLSRRNNNNNTKNSSTGTSSSTPAWFYLLLQSVLLSFSGGIFGTILLGKPCPFLINDIHIFSCLAAFILVQQLHTSMIHTYIWTSIPMQLMITSYAQLFRTLGLIKFVTTCYRTLIEPQFIGMSTKYYNIPIFGPILYGILLGNMSGFILHGIDGHTKNGMPYPFQNGIFCASFYHFYVHDTTGMIGRTLRQYLQPLSSLLIVGNNKENENEIFATIVVSLFMQIVALLQMPMFYGPTFSPFVLFYNQISLFIQPFQHPEKQAQSDVRDDGDDDDDNAPTTPTKVPAKMITRSARKKKTAFTSTEDAKNKDL